MKCACVHFQTVPHIWLLLYSHGVKDFLRNLLGNFMTRALFALASSEFVGFLYRNSPSHRYATAEFSCLVRVHSSHTVVSIWREGERRKEKEGWASDYVEASSNTDSMVECGAARRIYRGRPVLRGALLSSLPLRQLRSAAFVLARLGLKLESREESAEVALLLGCPQLLVCRAGGKRSADKHPLRPDPHPPSCLHSSVKPVLNFLF